MAKKQTRTEKRKAAEEAKRKTATFQIDEEGTSADLADMAAKTESLPDPTEDTSSMPQHLPVAGRSCATCTNCDDRNVGFCDNPDARAQLDMWNGVIFLTEKFGCKFWSPRPEKPKEN